MRRGRVGRELDMARWKTDAMLSRERRVKRFWGA